MLKSYLQFEQKTSFGVITSCGGAGGVATSANILFAPPPPTAGGPSLGRFVITCALEEIVVWNVRQGEKKSVLLQQSTSETYKRKHPLVSRLALNPDGASLAAGYADGSIRIWDLKTSSVITQFSGHKSEVTALCYAQSVGYLLSGGKDTDLYVWDLLGEQGLFKLRGHKNAITEVKFLEKTKTIVSSSKDFLIKFWDLNTRHCVQTIIGHPSEVWSFDINPEETRMISICSDNLLRVYKLLSPSEIKNPEDLMEEVDVSQVDPATDPFRRAEYYGSVVRKSNEKGSFVKFTVEGSLIGVQGGKTLEIFEVNDEETVKKKFQRRKMREKEKHKKEGKAEEKDETAEKELQEKLKQMLVEPSDEYSAKQVLRLDVKIQSFDFLREKRGKDVVFSLSNNTIELYRRKRKAMDKSSTINLPGHRSDVRWVAFSSRDEMLFSASSYEIKVWNVYSTNCIRTMEADYTLCGFFAPGDRHIVTGTKNGSVEIYDLHSATCLQTDNTVHKNSVFALQMRPNKAGFISGGADKVLASWDFELVQTGEGPSSRRLGFKFIQSAEMPEGIFALRYSPNGKFIAVALMDYTIRIYFADKLKLYLTLYGHKLPVLSIDFSSDNTLIVSGSADKNVSIWGVDFGDCHKSLFAHAESVMQVRFVPETHYFFSCGKDGLIKYWDADKFEHIMTLEGHHQEIWGLALSMEGNLLASAGSDRSIRIWRQTDNQLFLDSRRQEEMEEAWDRDMEFEEERVNQLENNKEVGDTTRLSTENIKQGERILEALDLVEAERIKMDDYKKALAEDGLKLSEEKGETDEQSIKKRKKETQPPPPPPPPEPSPLLLGKSPSDYLLWVISKIKPTNLESALAILPFSHVLTLFSYLQIWAQEHKEIMMVCRILFFLMKSYQVQISVNRSLYSTLCSLKKNIHAHLERQKEIVDFNLAAMGYMRNSVEFRDNKDFYEIAGQLSELKKKKKKQEKQAVPYWLQKDSDEDEKDE